MREIRKPFCILVLLLSCSCGTEDPVRKDTAAVSHESFRHRFVVADLPGAQDWGYGTPAMADFDRDGDLDYAFGVRGDRVYWYETRLPESWILHEVGRLPIRTLGGMAFDVDGDSWEDVVIGSYWYRNSQDPKGEGFQLFQFDSRIEEEIHDLVAVDIDVDGRLDVLMMGDGEGVFWYRIPSDPLQDSDWERTTVTLDVLEENDAIHSGFYPRGAGDLDGDGDPDVVMPDRWYENRNSGTEWRPHSIPFGKRGPWGLSARSWICDLDDDGDPDIVMVDSDQKASRAAWLENRGGRPPAFTAHFLPMTAPGIRGSFHSLAVGDFDGDGDPDIFTADQEDDSILPEGAPPRWYLWENIGDGKRPEFEERVIFDGRLGAHDALVGDVDGDGDLDIFSKVWNVWPENGNEGREHGDFLENLQVP